MVEAGGQEELELLVQAAAEAKLLAAEREHEVLELRKRLARFESVVGDSDQDAVEEEEFTEVLSSGNSAIENGNTEEALRIYVMALGSLWNRYVEEKKRAKARIEVEAEVRQKWIDEMGEKENAFQAKLQALQDDQRDLLQAQQVDFIVKLEEQQALHQSKLDKQKEDFEARLSASAREHTERENLLIEEKENLQSEVNMLKSTVESLHREKASLESSTKEARDKAAETATLLDQNKDKMRELWKKHKHLKEESAKKGTQIEELRSQVAFVQAKAVADTVPRIVGLAANHARIEALESDIKVTRAQLQEESAMRAHEIETQQMLETTLAMKEEALQTLEDRLRIVQQEKEQFEAQYKTLAEVNSQERAREMEARREERETLLAEKAQLLAQVVDLQSQLQSQAQSRAQETDELKFECATLGEDLVTANTRLLALESQLRDTKAELESLREASVSLRHLEPKLDELIAEKSALELQLQETKLSTDQVVQDANAKVEQVLAEKSAVEQKLAALRDELIQNRTAQLAGLTANQARLEELEAQLSGQRTILETKEREHVLELKTLRDELESKVQDWESRATKAKSEHVAIIEQSQTRVAALDEQIASRERRIIELETSVTALQSELEQKRTLPAERESELEAALQTAEESVRALEMRLGTTETELREERDRVELLNVEMEELLSERNKLKASLDDEREKLVKSNERLVQLEKELGEVKHELVTDRVTRIPALEANAKRVLDLEAELDQTKQAINASSEQQLTQRPPVELELKTKRLHELEAEVMELRSSHASKVFQLEADLLRAKDELELRVSEERRSIQLESDLESTRTRLQEALSNLASVQAEREEVQSREKSLRDDLDRLVHSRDADSQTLLLTEKLRELELELESKVAEIATAKRRMEELSQELDQSRRFAGEALPTQDQDLQQQQQQRTSELELELKRVRAEAAFNIKNLQAECEALRRRVEEMGVEQVIRQRTRAASDDVSLPAGPLRRNISEVEAQRIRTGAGRQRFFGTSDVARLQHQGHSMVDHTPESQSRHQPMLDVGGDSMLPRMHSFDVPDESSSHQGMDQTRTTPSNVSNSVPSSPMAMFTQREKELETELKRVRSESASTTKNLQSECEALRRRVEDLESERDALHEGGTVGAAASEEGGGSRETQVKRKDRRQHQRTMSEVESQRSHSLAAATRTSAVNVADTPESQRHLVDSAAGKIRNPIRALRLTTTPQRPNTKPSSNRVIEEIVPVPGDAENAESTKQGEDVYDGSSRVRELEEELRRLRQEYSETTKDLQAECEALRRRLEEVGAEQEARERSMHNDDIHTSVVGSSSPHAGGGGVLVAGVPPRSVSALESQRSLSSSSLVEMVDKDEGVYVQLQQQHEEDLRRLRDESSLTIRDLQVETEALRRRIIELEAEKQAETDLLRRHVEERGEAERLRSKVRHLEQTEAEVRVQMEALEAMQSMAEEKDRELREALDRLQAGNETLDDLRTSLQGAQGRFSKVGDRAQSLVASVSRLQAERDAMKVQIRAAYGMQEEEEEETTEGGGGNQEVALDAAVDAAHSASDDALNAAKSLASDLAHLAQEEDVAQTLEEALRDAQACLNIVLQLESSAGLADLTSKLTAITESISQTVMAEKTTTQMDEAVQRREQEEEEEVLATVAGEDTVEKKPMSPVVSSRLSSDEVNGEGGSGGVASRATNEFFINRILDLEKDRAALMDRLSRAETELAMRKDLFSFVSMTSQSDQHGGGREGGEQKPFQTPSKFASIFSNKGDALAAVSSSVSSQAMTPWKNAAWRSATPSSRKRRGEGEHTAVVVETKEDVSSWQHKQQQSLPDEPYTNASSWGYPANEWEQQQHQQQHPSTGWQQEQEQQQEQPAGMVEDAAQWSSQHQQQDPTSWNTNASSSSTDPFNANNNNHPQAEYLNQQQQQLPLHPTAMPTTMATPAAVTRRTVANRSQRSSSSSSENKQQSKKKPQGPGILAIAFGIGTYHPEWKPDPKELEEENSDFEDEDEGKDDADNNDDQRQQQQSFATRLELPQELSGSQETHEAGGGNERVDTLVPNDPFAAAARIHSQSNSPRYAMPTDPFARQQPRRMSFENPPLQPPPSRPRPGSFSQPAILVQEEQQQQRSRASSLDQWPQQQQQSPNQNTTWQPPSTPSTQPQPLDSLSSWEQQQPPLQPNPEWEQGQWIQDAESVGTYPPHPHSQYSDAGTDVVKTIATESETVEETVNEWGEKVTVRKRRSTNEWGETEVTGSVTLNEWGEKTTNNFESDSLLKETQHPTTPSAVVPSEVPAGPTEEDVLQLNAELSELAKKMEELQAELQTEREARLFRESQFEVAESNLFNVVHEAEELKRRLREIETDLQDARMIVGSTAAARMTYADPPATPNVSATIPTTIPSQPELEQERGPLEGEQTIAAEEGEAEGPLLEEPSLASIVNLDEETLRRKEEEFFMIRMQLESKLQDALSTIEDLHRRLGEIELQQPPPQSFIAAPTSREEVPKADHAIDSAMMEQLRETLQQREEDVLRLTQQLTAATYALYRCREESSRGGGWTTTMSLAIASFTVSAFFPTETAITRVLGLLSGDSS